MSLRVFFGKGSPVNAGGPFFVLGDQEMVKWLIKLLDMMRGKNKGFRYIDYRKSNDCLRVTYISKSEKEKTEWPDVD